MTYVLKLTILALMMAFAVPCVQGAFWSNWFRKKKKEEPVLVVQPDPERVQNYSKIIANASYESQGMVNVYKYRQDYYFEIPTQLMGRDLLVVNKLTSVSPDMNRYGANRGSDLQSLLVGLELTADFSQVLLRQRTALPEAAQGSDIARSIAANYVAPVMESFKVEGHSKDSTAVIIKVTNLFNGQNTVICNPLKELNISATASKELSHIDEIVAFGNNVVAYSQLTARTSSKYTTIGVSCSIVLLPSEQMPRRADTPRLGFFSTSRLTYADTQQRVDRKRYITRWRLTPSDTAAYLRGQLVAPVKPIKFYLDGNVPRKWIPYLAQGISDWNRALEHAGFKDAIVVECLPPDSIAADDINFSTLNYAASTKVNAMGPTTIDPRSGEILEADIMWWHNVISQLQQWLTVQTGPVNPAARLAVMPDSLIGQAMRYVACHEVGHSLGLRHNMIASYAIPTDSLRSPSFTARFGGTAASIMDYARFNYVAQPADGVSHLAPAIGPYDCLAIEYAYRWFPTPDAEAEGLRTILQSHSGSMYRYAPAQPLRTATDPRAMSEDLGDDAVEASQLGIANLKMVMDSIVPWTTTGQPGQTYEEASRLYYAVVQQWNRYLYHVLACVGGIYIDNTTVGDGNRTFTFVEKEKQQQAVKFLIDNVLTEQQWLFNPPVADYAFVLRETSGGQKVEYAPSQVFKNSQAYILYDLLHNDRLLRMAENESRNGRQAYTTVELMNQLHQCIFGITRRGGTPTVAQRNTQKIYVDVLITAANSQEGIKIDGNQSIIALADDDQQLPDLNATDREISFYGSLMARNSDAISVKRGEMLRIRDLLKSRLYTPDEATRYHYKDLIIRIENALEMN